MAAAVEEARRARRISDAKHHVRDALQNRAVRARQGSNFPAECRSGARRRIVTLIVNRELDRITNREIANHLSRAVEPYISCGVILNKSSANTREYFGVFLEKWPKPHYIAQNIGMDLAVFIARARARRGCQEPLNQLHPSAAQRKRTATAIQAKKHLRQRAPIIINLSPVPQPMPFVTGSRYRGPDLASGP